MYQSFSTLGSQHVNRAPHINPVLESPIIASISKSHGVSPAQTVLKWALQKGIGVIPRSLKQAHIKSNTELNFLLLTEEMNKIDSIKIEDAQSPKEDDPRALTIENSGEHEVLIYWVKKQGSSIKPGVKVALNTLLLVDTMPPAEGGTHTRSVHTTYPGHQFLLHTANQGSTDAEWLEVGDPGMSRVITVGRETEQRVSVSLEPGRALHKEL